MSNAPKKERLDNLVARKISNSRTKAQAIIMAGQVFVEGKKSDKPGTMINSSSDIKVKELFPYVSRGALKIEKAHKEFRIDFKDKIVCDIGSSTGGFTDYALQNGAKKVYAIDVGKGQLAQKIREDNRVKVMEETNIKNVNSLPEKIDIFVTDVSFISVKIVLAQIKKIQKEDFKVIALVKPQFEVGKEVADKFRGVITNQDIQEEVLENIKEYARTLSYTIKGETVSPIKGAKGNKEFLLYLKF